MKNQGHGVETGEEHQANSTEHKIPKTNQREMLRRCSEDGRQMKGRFKGDEGPLRGKFKVAKVMMGEDGRRWVVKGDKVEMDHYRR